MRFLLFLLTMLLSLCNCSDNTKLLEEISRLQKKPITLLGYDNVLKNHVLGGFSDNEVKPILKYVIYNDSLGCTSCSINKMHLWDNLIEYANSYKGKLVYYFIYSPSEKDRRSLALTLSRINFNYPVLLDTLCEFAILNPHIPKNRALHTFLLDENDNVILVGNPLHNKKIEELFYKIVEEKLGKPQQATTDCN